MAKNPPYSLPPNTISSLNNQNVISGAPWISGAQPQSVHTTAIGIGSGGTGVYPWVQSGTSYQNGTIVTICFTDAKGQNWALDVDPVYAQTLLQISQGHQAKAQYANANGQVSVSTTPIYSGPKPVPIPVPMIEGDFTEGEMELAENLIAELEGGTKKGSKQNIQADIDCAA